MSNDIESIFIGVRPSKPIDPEMEDLVSEWQYSQIKLRRSFANPAVRREAIQIVALLALVFAWPYYVWLRRWLVGGSLQTYGLFVLPMALGWIWVARYWLFTPEIGPLRREIREEHRNRVAPRKAGVRELTVLRVLVEGAPVIDRRTPWPLAIAVVVDAAAFWVQDPTLMCIGFILTIGGIVLFRFGKLALRAALFPYLLLFAMVPFPGLVQDAIANRIEPACFGPVEHMMTNLHVPASVTPEGNPLTLTIKGQPYRIYAEKVGLCIPEAMLVLLFLILYLSLIRTRTRFIKLGPFLCTCILVSVLVELRLILICYVATIDRDVAMFFEPITRLLLPLVGLTGAYLLSRGFQCVKLHRWVAFSLKP